MFRFLDGAFYRILKDTGWVGVSGKLMASLDEKSVYQALRALRTGAASHSPLSQLQIVDDVINTPGFPNGSQAREYALNQILSRTISDSFAQQRIVLDHAPPSPHETRAEAFDSIHRDGLVGNLELLGWSWLYYHFVRVDLQITAAEFCSRVGVDPRTLRRYQRRAIHRLTGQLIQAEHQARLKQRLEQRPSSRRRH